MNRFLDISETSVVHPVYDTIYTNMYPWSHIPQVIYI